MKKPISILKPEFIDEHNDIIDNNISDSLMGEGKSKRVRDGVSKDTFIHYRSALASVLKRKYRGSRANKAISYLYMKLYSTKGEDALKAVVQEANIKLPKKRMKNVDTKLKHKKELFNDVHEPKLKTYYVRNQDGFNLISKEG